MMLVIVLACTLVAYHVYWYVYTEEARKSLTELNPEYSKVYFKGQCINAGIYVLVFALTPVWFIALVVAWIVGSIPLQKKALASELEKLGL